MEPVVAELADFVRAREPGADLSVFDEGWDHVVIAADGRGYRFVRDEADREASLGAEAALLARLAPASPVPIPILRLHNENGMRFATFEWIPGEPLTPRLFATLDVAARERIAAGVAAFLSHLHSISEDEAHALGLREDLETYGAWVDETLRAIEPHLPARAMEWIARVVRSEVSGPPRRTAVHNDLTHFHVMVDANELSGVIDFADAAIGDPARDFGFEGAYGSAFLNAVYESYAFPRDEWFDARRLQLEVRTLAGDLEHALGLNPEHNFGRPDWEETARLVAALDRMASA